MKTELEGIKGPEDPASATERPYAPVPEFDSPLRGQEVYAPTDGPFEVPAEVVEKGPFYAAIDEVMPEVGERPEVAVAAKAKTETARKLPVDRRDFMKLFSAGSLASATACLRRPMEKAIPFVSQAVDTTYGRPVAYASTCGECSGGCGIMVQTREGRPVKVEGLPGDVLSNGRLCAIGQSTLQGLYHPERRTDGPRILFGKKYENVPWEDAFEHLGRKFEKGPKVGILTGGSTGHRHAFFKEFLEKIGSSANHLYTYEANSLMESIAAAHQMAYGLSVLPRVDFAKARLVVGIGSDFLDVGSHTVYNTYHYSNAHGFNDGGPSHGKSRHVQFESTLTLTGARADERQVIAPGSETLVSLLLIRSLLDQAGARGSSTVRAQAQQIVAQYADMIKAGEARLALPRATFDKLADELLATPSVVLCGGSSSFDENATTLQLAAILVNELIGAYDQTLHISKDWFTSPVQPGDLKRFLADAATLDALIVIDTDPLFSLPASFGIEALLKKIPVLVSIQGYPTETCRLAHYQLPGTHSLECWGDEQSMAGYFSTRQPAVRATSDVRSAEETLMWVAAHLKKPLGYQDYRDYLRKKWAAIHQLVGSSADFDTFFDSVLQRGHIQHGATQTVAGLSSNVAASFKLVDTTRNSFVLISPLDYRLREGRQAHKPILQEAADTLTTIAWDSFVAMNPTVMRDKGFKQFDVVRVESPAGSFEASLYPLPGLHPDAVVVPRGNGHSADMGTIERNNGVNPLVCFEMGQDALTGAPVTTGQAVKITRTGAVFQLAAQQKHNDIANRTDIYKQVSVKKAVASHGKTIDLDDVPDMYPDLPKKDYLWGMSIDLSRCTGCNACYVACSTENNVPQVGRDQFILGREMHWIKIDRYFSGSTDAPGVALMPMLCQHCAHAPCEAVCPVFATTHDNEGVNAMTYNRCIGTRYCANACPYKVRRFNWWTHKWGVMGERKQDRIPRAMNPDVTVRTRGVMEKCSFCYQRIRDMKHTVKLRGTPLVDGELQTACQQTCPANAITFGNLLDASSVASKSRANHRAYMALGGDPEHKHYGLKTLPSVTYLRQVSHNEAVDDTGHGSGHGGHEGSTHGGNKDHHG